MNESFLLKAGAYLSLVLVTLIAIQSIEARRRSHEDDDDDSNVHTNRQVDCDSDLRPTSEDDSETPKWRQPMTNQRIVNGRKVNPGEFPFIVRLNIGNGGRCTGTIIDKFWILTAAHCVTSYRNGSYQIYDPDDIVIVVGDWRTDSQEDREVYHKVNIILTHRNYRKTKDYSVNDVALLLTREKIQFSQGGNYGFGKVGSVKLAPPEGPAQVARETFTLAGWGLTASGVATKQIMAFNTKLDKCDDPLVPPSPQYICAVPEENQGTCAGDSGGPLFLQPRGGGPPVQYGIIAFMSVGPPCGGQLEYYVNVGYFLPWIREHVYNVRSTYLSSSSRNATEVEE